MTAWTDFVSKIYHEGHNKNSSYSFKQALKDASKRKGEMGMSKSMKSNKNMKSMKSNKSRKNMKNRSQMKKSKRGTQKR